MIVHISNSEFRILTFTGCLRYHATSEQGVERKQSEHSALNIVIDGVISEYAASKAFNVSFDLNCDYRKFGADLISQKGAKIDVKSTRIIGGNLNAVKWSSEKEGEIFVLTELHYKPEAVYVDVVGWIEREKFLIPENIKDVGNGEFYSLPRERLNLFL